MAVTMEQIDELRRRTNCSYEEAKILLEKHNGDLLDAIVEFERKNGFGPHHRVHEGSERFGTRVKQLIHKGFKTRLIIERSGETIVNVSINIFIIAALVLHWFLLAALVISFIFGCRFKIRKEEGESVDINKMIDGFGSKIKETATGSKEKKEEYSRDSYRNKNKEGNNGVNQEEKYNEYTVE